MLRKISFEWEDDGIKAYADLMAALIQLGADAIEEEEIEEVEKFKPIKSKKPKPVRNFGPPSKMSDHGDSFPGEE